MCRRPRRKRDGVTMNPRVRSRVGGRVDFVRTWQEKIDEVSDGCVGIVVREGLRLL